MGYVSLKDGINYENGQQGWQVRAHISPQAVSETEDSNKIEVIKQCVQQVFGDDQVDLKIYQIQDENDRANNYDGALSQTGKDRTQLGKEVCIYLPDSHVAQLTSEQYKQRLITLWKLLQQNDVPLLHFNSPGDQSIAIGANDVPSPFSFTSQNPHRDEWLDKHGILFKEFEAHGEHPILDVEFTIDDLNDNGIYLNSSLAQSSEFLVQHSTEVQENINQQLAAVHLIAGSYEDLLTDDERTKVLLKGLVKQYNDVMAECEEVAKRDQVKINFTEALEDNEHYQRLVSGFPHEDDRNFVDNPLIGEIKARITGQLTDERIDIIVMQLRAQYEEKVTDIKAGFDDNHYNVGEYDLEELIAKNPAAMQSIFRQKAIINQETAQNVLMHGGIKVSQIALLNSYKAERTTKTTNQYFSVFGIFSRPFGAFSKAEKFAAVDAVIDAINNDTPIDKQHLGPLQQGNLGRLIQSLPIDVDSFVAKNEESALLD